VGQKYVLTVFRRQPQVILANINTSCGVKNPVFQKKKKKKKKNVVVFFAESDI